MYTPEELAQAGIAPDATAADCLWVESGLDWLRQRTTLPLPEGVSLAGLPAGAKLFLRQYAEQLQRSGITSESIEGLSQSFSSESLDVLLSQLAQSLLPACSSCRNSSCGTTAAIGGEAHVSQKKVCEISSSGGGAAAVGKGA